MRILVDEFNQRKDCPYCHDETLSNPCNLEDYQCAYKDTSSCHHSCYCNDDDMALCPYFVSIQETLKNNLYICTDHDDGEIVVTAMYNGVKICSDDIRIAGSGWD